MGDVAVSADWAGQAVDRAQTRIGQGKSGIISRKGHFTPVVHLVVRAVSVFGEEAASRSESAKAVPGQDIGERSRSRGYE